MYSTAQYSCSSAVDSGGGERLTGETAAGLHLFPVESDVDGPPAQVGIVELLNRSLRDGWVGVRHQPYRDDEREGEGEEASMRRDRNRLNRIGKQATVEEHSQHRARNVRLCFCVCVRAQVI